MKTVNILGAKWQIIHSSPEQCEKLREVEGFADPSTRTIIISNDSCSNEILRQEDLHKCRERILRHELIHAILFESGLSQCCYWASDETVVDWIALQTPKIISLFKELGIDGQGETAD